MNVKRRASFFHKPFKTKETIVAEQRKASTDEVTGASAVGDSAVLTQIVQKVDLKSAISFIRKGKWVMTKSIAWYGRVVSSE